MISGAGPVLVTSTVLRVLAPTALEPKSWVAGTVKVVTGAGATPVPVSVTSEGDPGALWAMLSVADFAPAVVGRTPR